MTVSCGLSLWKLKIRKQCLVGLITEPTLSYAATGRDTFRKRQVLYTVLKPWRRSTRKGTKVWKWSDLQPNFLRLTLHLHGETEWLHVNPHAKQREVPSIWSQEGKSNEILNSWPAICLHYLQLIHDLYVALLLSHSPNSNHKNPFSRSWGENNAVFQITWKVQNTKRK